LLFDDNAGFGVGMLIAAEHLMQMAEETVTRRWHAYEHLAKQEPAQFEQAG